MKIKMILSIILLIVGLILLVKGADFFVDGSSSIAKALRIPSIIIGLTFVAFGTSAPEAAVSIIAGIKGQNDIAMGNVVGSNLFNLLAVVGICAIIKPINIERQIIVKEYPFSIVATLALVILSCDMFFNNTVNSLSRSDGIVILLFFAIFLYSIITTALQSRENNSAEDAQKPKYSMGKGILFSILGLAGIIGGGQLVVNSATSIAQSFGISEALIGLTIVAIGTSLPELVTSIVAAKKGESDIAIGNVVGSNIFNIFFVLGASSAISPINISGFNIIDMFIMVGVVMLVYLFCITKRSVSRIEGFVLTALYIGYLVYIIMR